MATRQFGVVSSKFKMLVLPDEDVKASFDLNENEFDLLASSSTASIAGINTLSLFLFSNDYNDKMAGCRLRWRRQSGKKISKRRPLI